MDTSGNNNNNAAELDRQTQARLEEIEEEIKKQPLTSELKPLADMEAFYRQGEQDYNASHFLAGVQALQKDYSQIRLVRGDGNCYYRAFLYSLAEKIMQMQASSDNVNIKEGHRIVEWIKKDSWNKVLAAGYDEITMEAFYETIVELMEKIVSSSSSSDNGSSFLHVELNQENSTSDYCTWYLRVVTAMHLKSDPDRFLPFLEQQNNNMMDMQQFCQREVEPMVCIYEPLHMSCKRFCVCVFWHVGTRNLHLFLLCFQTPSGQGM
jgi:ubiquitin thioesterase protein OTUB1